MPRILQHALLEKLLRLPEVRTFVEDFRAATGLDLALRDALGRQFLPEVPQSSLCHHLAGSEPGRALCHRTRQTLYAEATKEAAVCRCDAGLQEVAVPLRITDITVGYFVFNGFRTKSSGVRDLHRVQHLLAKSGVVLPLENLSDLLSESSIISESARDAFKRIVVMASQQFALRASDHFMQSERPLPPLAHRARRHILVHGLREPCGLQEIAQACAVSTAHLSRVFHESTGLTITEYLARFRVEHALGLLKRRERSVTEIAFASGFQSISQFNRTFKRIAGCAPSRVHASATPMS